jgi:hypothetical protein
MSKCSEHCDGLSAEVSKSQGGAVRDSGPDSAKDPKESGDKVTHDSFFTKQDESIEDGPGKKNPHLPA